MQKTFKVKDWKAYRARHFKAIEKFHKGQAKIPFEQKINNLDSMSGIVEAMKEARQRCS